MCQKNKNHGNQSNTSVSFRDSKCSFVTQHPAVWMLSQERLQREAEERTAAQKQSAMYPVSCGPRNHLLIAFGCLLMFLSSVWCFFEHVWSLINVLYISYLKWSGPEMTCWVGDQTPTNRLLVDMFLSKCVQPGWCFTHWMQLVLLFFGFDAVRNERQQRWYNVMINYVHAFFF